MAKKKMKFTKDNKDRDKPVKVSSFFTLVPTF